MLRFLELMAFVALVPMDIWPPLHAAGCTRGPGKRRLLGREPENQRLESGEHGERPKFSWVYTVSFGNDVYHQDTLGPHIYDKFQCWKKKLKVSRFCYNF